MIIKVRNIWNVEKPNFQFFTLFLCTGVRHIAIPIITQEWKVMKSSFRSQNVYISNTKNWLDFGLLSFKTSGSNKYILILLRFSCVAMRKAWTNIFYIVLKNQEIDLRLNPVLISIGFPMKTRNQIFTTIAILNILPLSIILSNRKLKSTNWNRFIFRRLCRVQSVHLFL